MKLKILGTAAFEGIPSLFCCCEACQNAKKNGGKDIRTRTQAILDDKLLIDFPADSMAHAMKYNIDFGSFTSLLVTHSHSDHLYPNDLVIRSSGFSRIKDKTPLHIYVGENGKNKITSTCGNMIDSKEMFIHDIKEFEPFNVEGYDVIPIPASHDIESSPYIFIISKDGKTMLYGNDTGTLYPEVLEKLLKLDVKFDLIMLDCTMGESKYGYYGHFTIKDGLNFEKVLSDNHMLNDNCIKIVTHFSHNNYVSHKYFEDILQGTGFIVAYDGLEIEF